MCMLTEKYLTLRFGTSLGELTDLKDSKYWILKFSAYTRFWHKKYIVYCNFYNSDLFTP